MPADVSCMLTVEEDAIFQRWVNACAGDNGCSWCSYKVVCQSFADKIIDRSQVFSSGRKGEGEYGRPITRRSRLG